MNNKKKHIKKYVEGELSNFHLLVKEYQELRTEIILSKPILDGQPKGNKISKTTENKVCRLESDPRLLLLERNISSMEKILNKLPIERKQFIKCKYWDKNLTPQGLAAQFNIDVVTAWRWSDAIIEAIAREIGLL